MIADRPDYLKGQVPQPGDQKKNDADWQNENAQREKHKHLTAKGS
jgi:hypothetical protein